VAPDERPKPDRTIVRVMVRPRWIAMLLLAIAIAGAFAWLGHWQLERAVVPAADTAEVSEIARPIGEAQTPGKPMYDTSIGQTVTAEGRYVPGDFSVITERVQDGRTGYWVAAHFEQKAGSEGTRAKRSRRTPPPSSTPSPRHPTMSPSPGDSSRAKRPRPPRTATRTCSTPWPCRRSSTGGRT
jgi:hypothetical protein